MKILETLLQHSRAGTRNHIIGLNNKDTNKYVSSKLFYSIDGTVDVSGNNVEKNDNIDKVCLLIMLHVM